MLLKTLRRFSSQRNQYLGLKSKIGSSKGDLEFFNLSKLEDSRFESLPFSIRILLENAIRNNDEFVYTQKDVETILNWEKTASQAVEIPFKPSRVLLQDFTGVPAVVDLAAMRDAVSKLGVDPMRINPLCPVDLVIDHSIQVDVSRKTGSKELNEDIEFRRNKERFEFLKWGQKAFDNFKIIPPGNGIVHQVNLEYLAQVVFNKNNLLYPDSVVGTDSHTTMINGLGVVGWGVGGIEAEAVMLGQHISMVLPEVIGFKLTGKLNSLVTATDLVLTIVQMLRQRGVVGKFVEFFGDGVDSLTVEDRATISNMGPEYGATIGYFPVDKKTLNYLTRTNRDPEHIQIVEQYLQANKLLRDYNSSNNDAVKFTGEVLELDLGAVEACLSGPKRPHDKVLLSQMQTDYNKCLTSPVGFKGFGLEQNELKKEINFMYDGKQETLRNGDIVISSITSCTNTSNPSVMLAAGMLAQNAVKKGLTVKPYLKTSLSPGSGVVKAYLENADLLDPLQKLGFHIAGFGCMTCIGNSGELDEEVNSIVKDNDMLVASVLSGNRNFEGRVHPLTKANYLASPPLCVAYALAGTVDFNFETDSLGNDQQGNPVFLKDLWPTNEEISEVTKKAISRKLFEDNYSTVTKGSGAWASLEVSDAKTYPWNSESTYIHNPPFFQGLSKDLPEIKDIKGAYCLLNLGDSITTDHISPAGKIAMKSSAATYLQSKDVKPLDFNSYGSRRGNDEIMARGTFANIRLINKLADKPGPIAKHIPTGEWRTVFDVANEYLANGQDTVVLAGQEYGSGSSRDWAAKGPYLLGVKVVIAQSFERIHRSNLIGMGILPLEFLPGQNADTFGITGEEQFNICLNKGDIAVNEKMTVTTTNGKSFQATARLDTDIEIEYYKNGGILKYVIRSMIK